MTIIDDLTFLQLSQRLPEASVQILNGVPVLNLVYLLELDTENVPTTLDFPGVVKLLYRLRAAAGNAQNVVNSGLTQEDIPLDAFPAFSFGTADEQGNIPVSQITQVTVSIDPNTVKGKTA
jgi:hypothetical protein